MCLHKLRNVIFPYRLQKLEALSQICPLINKKLTSRREFLPRMCAETLKNISLSAQQGSKIIWNGIELKDDNYFADILTDFGYCSTFNMIDLQNIMNTKVLDKQFYNDFEIQSKWSEDRKPYLWSLENGYSPDAHFRTYPIRSFEADGRIGFKMTLKLPNEDIGIPCTESNSGYKVVVHHPAELPMVSKNYIQASFNQKSTIIIKPYIVKTSDELNSYSSDR